MTSTQKLNLPDDNPIPAKEMRKYTNEEIVQIGKAIYQLTIQGKIERPDNLDHYLGIDILTGNYEIDSDTLSAIRRLRDRNPDAVIYGRLVGSEVMGRI